MTDLEAAIELVSDRTTDLITATTSLHDLLEAQL